MRFAYLIFAYRDLDQVRALVARLLRDDPNDFAVIHYDARSPVSDAALEALAAEFPGAVVLTRRVPVLWAHPSQSQAMLLMLDAAARRGFDYVHLLSGQDWPIQTKADIVAAITPGDLFLGVEGDVQAHRMNDHQWHNHLIAPTMTLSAAEHYRKQALRRAGAAYDAWLRRIGRARTCPFGPVWKKGSTWWSLPADAVAYLRPRLRDMVEGTRLRHTICSDEHLIQTILFYSPHRERLRANHRFIRWEGGSSPAVLTAADLPALHASDAWYARKVDPARDDFFSTL